MSDRAHRHDRDTVLGYDDVVVPENRLGDQIREEQNEYFFGARIQSGTN
jgi:hypothetical protein